MYSALKTDRIKVFGPSINKHILMQDMRFFAAVKIQVDVFWVGMPCAARGHNPEDLDLKHLLNLLLS
jgi:hypothetical protein